MQYFIHLHGCACTHKAVYETKKNIVNLRGYPFVSCDGPVVISGVMVIYAVFPSVQGKWLTECVMYE